MSYVIAILFLLVAARGLIALVYDSIEIYNEHVVNWLRERKMRRGRPHLVRPGVIVREVDLSTYIPEMSPCIVGDRGGVSINNPEQYLQMLSSRAESETPGGPVFIQDERDFRIAFSHGPWIEVEDIINQSPGEVDSGLIYYVISGTNDENFSRFAGKLVTYDGSDWAEYMAYMIGDIFIKRPLNVYVFTSDGWTPVRNSDEVLEAIQNRLNGNRRYHAGENEEIDRRIEAVRQRERAELRDQLHLLRATSRTQGLQQRIQQYGQRRDPALHEDGSINSSFIAEMITRQCSSERGEGEEGKEEQKEKRPARKLHIPGE